MKFINKRTDVILEPRNQMVEDQLRKSADYAPYEPQKAADGGDKPLAKMNKAELLEAAHAAGIAVPDDATKVQIVDLIQEKGREQVGTNGKGDEKCIKRMKKIISRCRKIVWQK